MAENHQADPKKDLLIYRAANNISVNNKENEVENEKLNGPALPIKEADEAPAADEYPHGLSLIFVVVRNRATQIRAAFPDNINGSLVVYMAGPKGTFAISVRMGASPV